MIAMLHVVLFVVLLALASLAVDWGRVQLAKTELLHAADASARASVATLYSAGSLTAAQNAAVTFAADNRAAGNSVVLDPNNDLDFGTWNASTRTFTPLAGSARASATAVRVRLSLTAAKGSAVPLAFGALLGQSTCNVSAKAVAAVKGGYGIVGLNSISMNGNSTDSYWSPTGYTSGGQRGAIASNGNISLSGSSYINGDARPGPGMSVDSPTRVGGSIAPLTAPLSYPNGNAGSYATSNDNPRAGSLISGGSLTLGNGTGSLPAGNYYVQNFSVTGNAILNVTGKATIYVTGTINLTGTVTTSGNLPGNLTVIVCGNGSVSVGSNATVYMNLYAPQSAVTASGSSDFYGSIVGLTVSTSGSSSIHYDLSANGGGSVSSVQ